VTLAPATLRNESRHPVDWGPLMRGLLAPTLWNTSQVGLDAEFEHSALGVGDRDARGSKLLTELVAERLVLRIRIRQPRCARLPLPARARKPSKFLLEAIQLGILLIDVVAGFGEARLPLGAADPPAPLATRSIRSGQAEERFQVDWNFGVPILGRASGRRLDGRWRSRFNNRCRPGCARRFSAKRGGKSDRYRGPEKHEHPDPYATHWARGRNPMRPILKTPGERLTSMEYSNHVTVSFCILLGRSRSADAQRGRQA
jgi:hypothetical protein